MNDKVEIILPDGRMKPTKILENLSIREQSELLRILEAAKRLHDKGFQFLCWNTDYTIDFTINGQNTKPFELNELSRDLCTVFNRPNTGEKENSEVENDR